MKAQTTTATILGTVTDPSGGAVPNASVQVKNTGTGATYTAMSDAQGRFTVPDLPVGTYDVQTSAPGFQTMVKTGITLTVGGQSVVNFPLIVGQVQQTVTVESQAVQVQTTSTEVSTLVTPVQMSQLPLNGRNFEQLIQLGSGVQTVTSSNHDSFNGETNLFSVAGARPEGAFEELDDSLLTTFWGLGSGAVSLGTDMGVEAIGEFQTLTNTYSAQFGGNGAVINATTKSGTNNLHGSLLEFLRNSGLDARNFNDGPQVPEFRQNQFGGSLGGPIVKNKLFFFVDYEGLRRIEGTTETAFVPDAAARAGYLPSGGAYAPFKGAAVGSGACTAAYVPGLSNCITNPEVQALLNLYPTTTASGLQNGTGIVSIPQVANTQGTEDYGVSRLDYTISDSDSLFGRYIIDWAFRNSPFNPVATEVPYWPEYDTTHSQYFVLEERHVFSPNLLNVARFSFSRPNQFAVAADANSAVAPGVPVNTSPLDFFTSREQGQLSVSGLATLGDDNLHLPYNLGLNRFDWGDDVLWTHGAHSIRFGVAVDRVQYNDQAPFDLGGSYSFNSLGSFLEGLPTSYTATVTGINDAFRYVRENEIFPYIQDDWRISSKLTANLGLRYEFQTDPSCRPCTLLGPNGNISQAVAAPPNFGYETVNQVFASNPSVRNFEPRIGLAYDPFADHKTSIRAGFGMFYDLIEPSVYMPGMWSAPPDYQITFTNPTLFPVPNSSVSTSALAATPVVIGTQPLSSSGDPVWNAVRTPYMMQWNLNVQHEFWDGTVVSLGYVASAGIDLINGVTTNVAVPTASGQYETLNAKGQLIPNPTIASNILLPNGVQAYGGASIDDPMGRSNYNSVEFSINHPIRHNVQLYFGYTYSKCLDIGSADSRGFIVRSANPSSVDPYNFQANYGPCSFNVTHAVRANGVITLPFKQNRLVSGWQLTPIFAYSTGSPFDVSGIGGWSGGIGINRPDILAGCNPLAGSGGAPLSGGFGVQWFNPNCFYEQPVGTLGNFGRDVLNAPPVEDVDFGFIKDTKLTERYNLEFRAEFFNIFNWTNFGYPTASIFSLSRNATCLGGTPGTTDSASCGVPTSSAGVITQPNPAGLAREIQFALKMVF